MNQGDFVNNPHVFAFLDWMQTEHWRERLQPVGVASLPPNVVQPFLPRLPRLAVRLNLPRSRFVPVPVAGVADFCDLPWLYVWKAAGMQCGDLSEAMTWLARFAATLDSAVAASSRANALAVCTAVLGWGGERNRAHGARPFLQGLGAQLIPHLQQHRQLMTLAGAVLDSHGDLPGVPHMNSMLSKVYSVLCNDGLPIYDSRVAGAIATLVETWRIERGLELTPIPAALRFPCVPPNKARRVHARYPGAADPGALSYGHPDTPKRWAGAAVRLGWLLQLMAGSQAGLQVTRTIEAALFMAGHDCEGINWSPVPGARVPRDTLHMLFGSDSGAVRADLSAMYPGHPWVARLQQKGGL